MPVEERRSLRARPARRGLALLSTLLTLGATSRAVAEPKSPPAVGYDYGDFAQPRGAALGGAVRALGNSIDALYANPANIAATRVYHLAGAAQFWPTELRTTYGGGVVDSLTSRLAGGVGAQYFTQAPDSLDRKGSDIRVALGAPVSELLLVGVAGRHLWLKENGPGPLGESLASGGRNDRMIVREFTFDAGVTLRPTKGLSLSAVGYNLTYPDHGFLPLMVGGGIGFGNQDFSVEADVLGDFRTWERSTLRAMGGFEFLAADHFPLRLGYRFDQGAESHAVSAGIGYIERLFSTSLSLRQTVTDGRATAVFLGFEYHLESSRQAPAPTDGF